MDHKELYSTSQYLVRIGESTLSPEMKGVPCYQLVNRFTGLVEGEGFNYPEAVKAAVRQTEVQREVRNDPKAAVEREQQAMSANMLGQFLGQSEGGTGEVH